MRRMAHPASRTDASEMFDAQIHGNPLRFLRRHAFLASNRPSGFRERILVEPARPVGRDRGSHRGDFFISRPSHVRAHRRSSATLAADVDRGGPSGRKLDFRRNVFAALGAFKLGKLWQYLTHGKAE